MVPDRQGEGARESAHAEYGGSAGRVEGEGAAADGRDPGAAESAD